VDARDGSGRMSFEAHRDHLTGLAYRMTGSVAEAEDLVQEAWLRWERSDRSDVVNARAWLSRVVSRLCLDHLGSATSRRVAYVGPWLPEPLLDDAPTAEDAAQLADDVSMALLVALERLSPLERAAFLLKDVFDVEYDEIATTLQRSEAACRKLASRARAHVREARPGRPASNTEQQRLLAAFATAVASGDVEGLKGVLTEDTVMMSDGGGQVVAAINPIRGADHVARFILGVNQKFPLPADGSVRVERVNGELGLVIRHGPHVVQTISFALRDGKVAAIYAQRNPQKLTHTTVSEPRGG